MYVVRREVAISCKKYYHISRLSLPAGADHRPYSAGHGALAGFLSVAEVDTLICGGIGPGARYALEDMGIRLLPGVMGNADDVVRSYLEGTLSYDPNAACHHHDHEAGHDCHHGQGCGDHKCN